MKRIFTWCRAEFSGHVRNWWQPGKTHYIPLMMLAVAGTGLLMPWGSGSHTSNVIISTSTVETPSTISIPAIIAETERDFYRDLFDRADKGDDTVRTTVDEGDVLRGHVLATLYLSRGYSTRYSELADWLAHYSDLPQAYDIYQLALSKKPGGEKAPQRVVNKARLQGYGDDFHLSRHREVQQLDSANWQGRTDAENVWRKIRSALKAGNAKHALELADSADALKLLSAAEHDVALWSVAEGMAQAGESKQAYQIAKQAIGRSGNTIPAMRWTAGLAAWKMHDYGSAARQFGTMADASEFLSPWESAAAAFWAYRSHMAAGNKAEAGKYLALAAEFPRTFYGILARKAQERVLELDLSPEMLDEAAVHDLYAIPAVQRAVALVEAGQQELAEDELRILFPSAEKRLKRQLLSLTLALDLPSLQIPMGRTLARDGRAYDYALYPTPGWEPTQGFDVEPALLFSFARQESGFKSDARSHTGAQGVMQILPSTARFMMQNGLGNESLIGSPASVLAERDSNLSLGQSYLSHLMNQKYIQGNLMYLAAAYNAGPGKLLEWQKTINYQNDPLLFLESIPYSETRRYVAQVLTNYWIYSEIITGKPVSLAAVLNGSWPQYSSYEHDIASAQ